MAGNAVPQSSRQLNVEQADGNPNVRFPASTRLLASQDASDREGRRFGRPGRSDVF
jgi:hypothetical protein